MAQKMSSYRKSPARIVTQVVVFDNFLDPTIKGPIWHWHIRIALSYKNIFPVSIFFCSIFCCLINDINKERAANVDIKDELSDITVLKVGHHGSKYATSDKLLKTIKPQYALISCGINNRYGHPHSETLERLEDNNCKVYVTNTLGEIIIRTDGYKISVHQYLQ